MVLTKIKTKMESGRIGSTFVLIFVLDLFPSLGVSL